MIVAIDGPSGAGKSTLAKRVAKELRFTYLDTGAIYRALALKILRRRVDLNDTAALSAIVTDSDIDLRGRNGQLQVILDGEDVSALIRTPEVSQMASKASAIATVRHRLLDLQRGLGRRRHGDHGDRAELRRRRRAASRTRPPRAGPARCRTR